MYVKWDKKYVTSQCVMYRDLCNSCWNQMIGYVQLFAKNTVSMKFGYNACLKAWMSSLVENSSDYLRTFHCPTEQIHVYSFWGLWNRWFYWTLLHEKLVPQVDAVNWRKDAQENVGHADRYWYSRVQSVILIVLWFGRFMALPGKCVRSINVWRNIMVLD